jgi:transcriptional regulator with XRE-family HTH domain
MMAVARNALVAFGKRLRKLRESRGFTQEELAHRAGFDRTYISLVERGQRNPSLINVLRLAEGLGLPPIELFKSPIASSGQAMSKYGH